MKLSTLTNRYRRFSRQPLRLPVLLGAILGLVGFLTLISFLIFWGSPTHRYIVDVQRASENRLDDSQFPLMIPGEFTGPPAPLDRNRLWEVEATIQTAAEDLKPLVDIPQLIFGLDFIDTREF